jgi:hypothetical protein
MWTEEDSEQKILEEIEKIKQWHIENDESIESIDAKIASGEYHPDAWKFSIYGQYKNPHIATSLPDEFYKKLRKLRGAGVDEKVIGLLNAYEELKIQTLRHWRRYREEDYFDENGQLLPCPYDIDELIKKHCPEK